MPQTLMEPPEALQPYAQVLHVGSTELHCFVAGPTNAPTILLIHGLGDEGDTWRCVLPALTGRYRVIAPDLPGFGRSPLAQRPITVATYARTLVALMGTLGIARATLVGHSGGAMVAQRIALGAPERVERLLLVGGCLPITRHLPPPGPLWAFLTPGLGELAYTSLRRSQDAAFATLRPYYADIDALPEEERAFLRQRVWARVWSDSQQAAFLSWLRWIVIDGATRADTYRKLLAASRVPTALVWGEADLLAPPTVGQAMASLIPGATTHVLPATGHNLHHEHPDALLELIG